MNQTLENNHHDCVLSKVELEEEELFFPVSEIAGWGGFLFAQRMFEDTAVCTSTLQ